MRNTVGRVTWVLILLGAFTIRLLAQTSFSSGAFGTMVGRVLATVTLGMTLFTGGSTVVVVRLFANTLSFLCFQLTSFVAANIEVSFAFALSQFTALRTASVFFLVTLEEA